MVESDHPASRASFDYLTTDGDQLPTATSRSVAHELRDMDSINRVHWHSDEPRVVVLCDNVTAMLFDIVRRQMGTDLLFVPDGINRSKGRVEFVVDYGGQRRGPASVDRDIEPTKIETGFGSNERDEAEEMVDENKEDEEDEETSLADLFA